VESYFRHRNWNESKGIFMLNTIAWCLTTSASVYGIPVMAIIMLLLVVRQSKRPWRECSSEIMVAGGVLLLMLVLVSLLNEHVVKPGFHIFRPNIMQLASNPSEQPALKISAADFYAMRDKPARSEYLASVMNAADYNGPELQPLVKRHWIEETGYSFPSGHTTAAMVLASFFLALALGRFSGRQLIPYLVLPFWALLVAWSRTVLQVHTPMDVLAGGAQGLVVGLLAWLFAVRLQRVRARDKVA
jgi:phosphatidylglycerophosphatase B